MSQKNFILLIASTVLVFLSIIGIIITKNNTKDTTFKVDKLYTNSTEYNKINEKASELINESGVFLLQTGDDNIEYLILDSGYMKLKKKLPYYKNVIIEKKEDSIMINFNEKLKTCSEEKYKDHRLIYKIIEDKDTKYIRVFKNGKETHFNSIIAIE